MTFKTLNLPNDVRMTSASSLNDLRILIRTTGIAVQRCFNAFAFYPDTAIRMRTLLRKRRIAALLRHAAVRENARRKECFLHTLMANFVTND